MTRRAHLNAAPTRPDNPAMADALALFAAAGRADRVSRDMTADWFDPPRAALIRRWLIYAWCTRNAPEHVPHFRALLRQAVACNRALRTRHADAAAAGAVRRAA